MKHHGTIAWSVIGLMGVMLAGCTGLALNEEWQEEFREAGERMRESFDRISWK